MFTHSLAGCLIFLLFGEFFNFEISGWYLICGVIAGMLPDIISIFFTSQTTRFNHLHRDNISHSILLPLIIFFIIAFLNIQLSIITLIAILSHYLIDIIKIKIKNDKFNLFVLGWGLKLFYPFSKKQIMFFYKKNKCIYTQKEIDQLIEQYGDKNWIKNLFFKPTVNALIEYLSLIITIILIIKYF
ncbi:MAG: metal-dependent hydrolase [bacterium]